MVCSDFSCFLLVDAYIWLKYLLVSWPWNDDEDDKDDHIIMKKIYATLLFSLQKKRPQML